MLVLNRIGLIEAMSDIGITQSELSRRTGIMPCVITKMINKPVYYVRVKTLSRLRKALECSFFSLVAGDINRAEIKKRTDD